MLQALSHLEERPLRERRDQRGEESPRVLARAGQVREDERRLREADHVGPRPEDAGHRALGFDVVGRLGTQLEVRTSLEPGATLGERGIEQSRQNPHRKLEVDAHFGTGACTLGRPPGSQIHDMRGLEGDDCLEVVMGDGEGVIPRRQPGGVHQDTYVAVLHVCESGEDSSTEEPRATGH